MVNIDFLYDSSKERFLQAADRPYYEKRQLSYREYSDALIVPPQGSWECGVFDSQKQYVKSTSMHMGCSEPLWDDSYAKSPLHRETVVFLGLFGGAWGHCITDCIRRLWFIKYSQDYRERFSDCKLVYICIGDSLSSSFTEFLQILGVDVEKLERITEPMYFGTVIVPDECFYIAEDDLRQYTDEYLRHYTDEYRRMIEEVRAFGRKQKKETGARKLYFSYSKYTKGKQVGEENLERYFQRQGYTIIYPERLTFAEQLNLLLNCSSFASTAGSCGQNCIFTEDDTEIIMIPRANYFPDYQLVLNELWGQPVYLVDANLSMMVSAEKPWNGPFFYYVSPNLRAFFHDTSECGKQYWKDNFQKFEKYLGDHFSEEVEYDIPSEYSVMAIRYMTCYKKSRFSYRLARRTSKLRSAIARRLRRRFPSA